MTITGSQISGSAACNGYGGEISMGADGLHLDEPGPDRRWPAWTRRQWPRRQPTWRPWRGSVRSCRDGDELVARGDGVELRFAGLPPPPTADLVGTTWVLETVLVGDVAASPVGEPATLELNEDGTFTGSTGCRTFSGDWIEQGDQIQAPSLAMDDTTCPAELSDQDDHVVSVIGDGFIPTIDGDLLTLMDPGGIGLVYRAED